MTPNFARAMTDRVLADQITTARDSLAFTRGARTALECLRARLAGTDCLIAQLAIVDAIDEAEEAEDALVESIAGTN